MWSRKSGPFLGGTALGRIFLAFGALFVIVGSYPLINSCSAFTNCNWFTTVSAGRGLLFSRVRGVIIVWESGRRSRNEYFFTEYCFGGTNRSRNFGPGPTK